jgi:hypothetical protein
MIRMNKDQALDWLWGTTFINLGLGALLWLVNSFALDDDNFDSSYDQANSLVWQGIGSNLLGFGVLVFVLTLATSAIVGALSGNLSASKANNSSSTLAPEAHENIEKKRRTFGEWLDEDKK